MAAPAAPATAPANDLDNLDALAAQADEGTQAIDNPVDPNAPPPPPPTDYGREASGAVELFAGLVVGYAPKAAGTWNPEAKQRTAAALAPVLEKYGFTFGGMPPEIILALVAGPLLWQSSRVVAAQMEEERAKSAQAEKAQKADPIAAMPTDTPMQARSPQEALYQ